MKSFSFNFLLFLILTISSCTTDLPWNEFQPNGGFGPGGGMMPGGPGSQGGGMSGALIDLEGIKSFRYCGKTRCFSSVC